MTQHTPNNRIDGFFAPHREHQDGTSLRPGLDTISSTPHAQGGFGMQRRREGAPIGGGNPSSKVNEFFHPPSLPNGGTTVGSPPLPDALSGKRPGTAKDSFFKRLKSWRPHKPSRRTVKRAAIIAAVLLVIILGYFIVRFFLAGGQIFKGNAFSAIFSSGKELKMDANGRTNIVLFGTSEDDPEHEGAELSDSIMIASLDQKKKDVFLVSVPRDLYVEYGMACNAGFEGKINEVYMCGKANGEGSEDAGQAAIREKAGEVFGLDVQYSAHVNYSAMRQAVDAVGGITVKIDSEDPRGILDRNFDWKCNYNCHYVKHPNGPAKLNGEQALALARARGSIEPTYGLGGGNFDREQYQQKILIALKEKAVSAGTLANPLAVNGLIDALGNNVKTNFDAEEVKTLAQLGQDISTDKIKSLSLLDEKNPLVTTANVGGASIVQPVAGLSDYSDIQAAVRAFATGDTAYLEGALVDILNVSGQAGVAQTKADELKRKGVAVEVIGNAPKALDTAPVRLYDLSGGQKPGTLKKLETILGTKAITTLPAGVTSGSDFVIIVGSNGTS